MKINYVKLFIAVAASLMAGVVGSIFTAQSIPTWYASLNKPSFNPPNWVFTPVWTTLYILMGLAAYLVWDKGWSRRDVRVALDLFGAQLVLNTVWSIIFFGLRNLFYAFIEIMILWVAVALTIKRFYDIDKRAAYLLIPYIFWISFASILNYFVWQMNP